MLIIFRLQKDYILIMKRLALDYIVREFDDVILRHQNNL